MASPPVPKILLTGATGYIGGTILTQLTSSSSPALLGATITCLVRGDDRASALTAAYGARVRPIVYRDLDDIDATVAAASEHDVVISATNGYHTASSQALLRGLALRKEQTGRDVWLIHTSGTGNLADFPVSGTYRDEGAGEHGLEFDDASSDVYGYETRREAAVSFPQRAAELAVINTGLELGVRTLVIMSPLIFGLGTGTFNVQSAQIPIFIRVALSAGRVLVAGAGTGVWDHVHVQDVAELYEIATVDIVQRGGRSLPSGRKGIVFSGNGRHSWRELAQEVADALHEQGGVEDRTVESIGLPELTKMVVAVVPFANEYLTELAVASNSRTVSTVGRKLGWKPSRGEEAWKKGFRDDVRIILEKSQ